MRAWLNRCRRWLWHQLFFRIVFGERARDGRPLKFTRISPSTCIEFPQGLDLSDHVFIGHFNFIEASGGVRIDEGVQITNFVSIVTHSSHRSLRLMGRDYAQGASERVGLVAGAVHVGAYSFIGPHSLIEPGARLGKGCVVAAYSAVRGEFADFSSIRGNPAQRVGDTRRADLQHLALDPALAARYREWACGGPDKEA